MKSDSDYKVKYKGDVVVTEDFWTTVEKARCHLCNELYEKPPHYMEGNTRLSCKSCDYSLRASDIYQIEKQKTGRASKEKLKEIFERETNIRNRHIKDLSERLEGTRFLKEKYDNLAKQVNLKIAHID